MTETQKLPTSAQLSTWGKALEVEFGEGTDKAAQVESLVGAANGLVARKLRGLPDDLKTFLSGQGVARLNGGSNGNGDTHPDDDDEDVRPDSLKLKDEAKAHAREAKAKADAKEGKSDKGKSDKAKSKAEGKSKEVATKAAADPDKPKPEKAAVLTKDEFAAERDGLRNDYRKGQNVLVQALGAMGKRAVRLRSAKKADGQRYIPHGEFMPWCNETYPEIPYQTVNLAVRVHEKLRHVYKDKLEQLTRLGITKLGHVLALPEPAKIVESGVIINPHTKERLKIYDEKTTVQDLKDAKKAIHTLETSSTGKKQRTGGRPFHFGSSSSSLLKRFAQEFSKLMATKEEELKDAKEQKYFKKTLIPMVEEWLEVAKSKVGI
jgi:hypothetical protein